MTAGAVGSPRLPGTDAPLAAGELVLLLDRKARRYLVVLEEGGEWHSHGGLLAHDALIGTVEGTTVRTAKAMEVTVLRPTREDLVLKMPRGAQVVYPKDQAMIVAFADIRPGSTVIEAGAGSGALTLALLDAVGPTGRVISVERREDHAVIARRNVERFHDGDLSNWELIVDDVVAVLTEHRAHRVVLDVLEPWLAVAGAAEALSPGGIVITYTPGVPQVMRVNDQLWADGRFAEVRTTETLVRPWDVDGLAVRPAHRMVAHTAFLTTARRVPAREDGGPARRRRKVDTGGHVDWEASDRARAAAAEPAEQPVGE